MPVGFVREVKTGRVRATWFRWHPSAHGIRPVSPREAAVWLGVPLRKLVRLSGVSARKARPARPRKTARENFAAASPSNVEPARFLPCRFKFDPNNDHDGDPGFDDTVRALEEYRADPPFDRTWEGAA